MKSVKVYPKKHVGASQVGTILGFNRWKDANTLKSELKNGYTQQVKECMNFGKKYEPVALRFYQRHTKTKIQKAGYKRDKTRKLIGIADGLIDDEGGLEIKCHMNGKVLEKIPDNYLAQVVTYMFLYNRTWWDFMSCAFDTTGEKTKLMKCHIQRIYWKNHKDKWLKDWYPKILDFTSDLTK
jgi:predicted phage-related endonuclease